MTRLVGCRAVSEGDVVPEVAAAEGDEGPAAAAATAGGAVHH